MRARGRLIGDQRYKIERIKPEQVRVAPMRRRRPPTPAPLVLLYGFAVLIAIGTFLLTLPISSAHGGWTPLLDALFTATSAVCVTGLVVVDTGTYWSGFGQTVIMFLIQIGGFGFMTSSTLLLLLVIRRRTRLSDRVMVKETMGTGELGNVAGLVRRVAAFTIVAEGVGMVVLTISFLLQGVAAPTALWFGAFHSISAFNNAGIDLLGSIGHYSLRGLQTDYLLLGGLGVLIVLGGLGYAIIEDVARRRQWRRLALETKVVLLATLALIITGTLAIAALEWDNPQTLGSLAPDQRVYNALFESITLRTAGFSALNTAALLEPTIFIVMALMFIGGASGSTAGGIKVNTFSVLLITIISTARGLPSAEVFGRRLEHIVVYRALAVALLSIAVLFIVSLLLEIISHDGFVDVLFEAVSGLATVGASRGITATLPDPAQVVLI
ncbi:MAG TPA: potassium transporter TrkG, partial [Candidatus Limnocylindrales bacterium]|nr:potassium transporter TrkG [Candidatus Limnocylindrales bacterium]